MIPLGFQKKSFVFQLNNQHIALVGLLLFIRVAIHSAVRVFTGEADEIATQHFAAFAVNFSRYSEALFLCLLWILWFLASSYH
jgi:hypothetical protein